MASLTTSSKPFQQEWLVVVPDFEGSLDKRLAVRSQHIAAITGKRQEVVLLGGAMTDDPIPLDYDGKLTINGSAVLLGVDTKEEVLEWLKADVYYKEKVWDVENAKITPFRTAFRRAHN